MIVQKHKFTFVAFRVYMVQYNIFKLKVKLLTDWGMTMFDMFHL